MKHAEHSIITAAILGFLAGVVATWLYRAWRARSEIQVDFHELKRNEIRGNE